MLVLLLLLKCCPLMKSLIQCQCFSICFSFCLWWFCCDSFGRARCFRVRVSSAIHSRYFWSGTTRLQVDKLQPNSTLLINLTACITHCGMYNLNRFRFQLPSPTGGAARVFFFPLQHLVSVDGVDLSSTAPDTWISRDSFFLSDILLFVFMVSLLARHHAQESKQRKFPNQRETASAMQSQQWSAHMHNTRISCYLCSSPFLFLSPCLSYSLVSSSSPSSLSCVSHFPPVFSRKLWFLSFFRFFLFCLYLIVLSFSFLFMSRLVSFLPLYPSLLPQYSSSFAYSSLWPFFFLLLFLLRLLLLLLLMIITSWTWADKKRKARRTGERDKEES